MVANEEGGVKTTIGWMGRGSAGRKNGAPTTTMMNMTLMMWYWHPTIN
jgi:hypothetical protein